MQSYFCIFVRTPRRDDFNTYIYIISCVLVEEEEEEEPANLKISLFVNNAENENDSELSCLAQGICESIFFRII